jgi:hypothetical protein
MIGSARLSTYREEMARGEEGFAEVTGNYFFWIADGGEVDAGVPEEKYIDVRRYMLELGDREDSRFPSTALRASLTGPLAPFGMTKICGGEQKGLQ